MISFNKNCSLSLSSASSCCTCPAIEFDAPLLGFVLFWSINIFVIQEILKEWHLTLIKVFLVSGCLSGNVACHDCLRMLLKCHLKGNALNTLCDLY